MIVAKRDTFAKKVKVSRRLALFIAGRLWVGGRWETKYIVEIP